LGLIVDHLQVKTWSKGDQIVSIDKVVHRYLGL
jgi:hypothetical protein